MARTAWRVTVLAAVLAAAGCSSSSGGATPDETAMPEAADVVEAVEAVEEATPAEASDPGPEGPVPVAPKKEKVGDVTVVWLSGTPREMGVQHGQLLHDEIAAAMEFVAADALLSAMPQVVEDTGILAILKASALPEILEECAGLVESAGDTGLDERMCLTLNMGDVALEFVKVGIPPEEPVGPGCTGVVATGAATPDGHVYHSRNLDWGGMDFSFTQEYPVVFVRQPAGGIPHVYVGFPLNLSPYTGMNAAGISIGTHQSHPASVADLSRTGRSNVQTTALILRDARSLAEAEAIVRADTHMMTGVLVVADGGRDTGAIFEFAVDDVAVRPVDGNGIAYATNHFVSEAIKPHGAKPSSGSTSRWLRLTQLVEPSGKDTVHGKLDPARLAGVMQDVEDPVTGIVPTLDELAAVEWDNGLGIGCNGAMHLALFDPGRRLFWVVAGMPPLHVKPYECFSLDELLGVPGAPPCPAPTL